MLSLCCCYCCYWCFSDDDVVSMPPSFTWIWFFFSISLVNFTLHWETPERKIQITTDCEFDLTECAFSLVELSIHIHGVDNLFICWECVRICVCDFILLSVCVLSNFSQFMCRIIDNSYIFFFLSHSHCAFSFNGNAYTCATNIICYGCCGLFFFAVYLFIHVGALVFVYWLGFVMMVWFKSKNRFVPKTQSIYLFPLDRGHKNEKRKFFNMNAYMRSIKRSMSHRNTRSTKYIDRDISNGSFPLIDTFTTIDMHSICWWHKFQ